MSGESGQGQGQDRLRVVEVCALAAGGVRAHMMQCARILAQDGHDVIVQAPSAVLAGAGDLLGGARSQALEIGARPSPADWPALVRLRRLGRGAHVVHAHGLRAGALSALALGSPAARRRRGGPRLVVTLHNLPVGSGPLRAVGRVLERVVARGADAVLAVSPDLAQRARERGARQVELAIVPAPSLAQTLPVHTAAATSPAEPGPAALGPWPAGTVRLLTVARLAPQKGMDLLLQAAQLLRDELSQPMTWAVAGDGPAAEEMAAQIRARDLPVVLLGRSEQASDLMRQADVVVQTSLWEGQPLAVQEALGAGAALVATDVGGTAVTARGGAVLVPPQAQAVAEAVAGLVEDEERLDQARRRASEAAGRLPGTAELAEQLERFVLGRDS